MVAPARLFASPPELALPIADNAAVPRQTNVSRQAV